MKKKYITEFYNYEAGVEYSLRWADEGQYNHAVAFLQDLTGTLLEKKETTLEVSSYFLLMSKEQVDALYVFRKIILANE